MKIITYDKTFLTGNLKGLTVKDQSVRFPDESVERIVKFLTKTEETPATDVITNATYIVSNIRVEDF